MMNLIGMKPILNDGLAAAAMGLKYIGLRRVALKHYYIPSPAQIHPLASISFRVKAFGQVHFFEIDWK